MLGQLSMYLASWGQSVAFDNCAGQILEYFIPELFNTVALCCLLAHAELYIDKYRFTFQKGHVVNYNIPLISSLPVHRIY